MNQQNTSRTAGTVPKCNRKIDTPYTQKHFHGLVEPLQ